MKYKIVTRVITFLVSAAIFFCIPANVFAYPVSYRLNFPTIQQEKSFWCWAACSCAIIEYYGQTVSQATFVRSVLGNENDEPVGLTEIRNGLSKYSINSTYVLSSLTLTEIRRNTYSRGRPVLAALAYSPDEGHGVVVIGYIDNSALDDHYVAYMDPLDGEIYTAEYSEFTNSNRQVWAETLTDIY